MLRSSKNCILFLLEDQYLLKINVILVEGSVDIEAHMIKCRQFTDIGYKFFHFDNQSNRIIVRS